MIDPITISILISLAILTISEIHKLIRDYKAFKAQNKDCTMLQFLLHEIPTIENDVKEISEDVQKIKV